MAFRTGAALAAVRAEISAEEKAREATSQKLRSAFEIANQRFHRLTRREQSFIDSIRFQMGIGSGLNARQADWLLEIGQIA